MPNSDPGHGAPQETIESTRDWQAYWNAVRERVQDDDYFRQVERTVGGRPIDEEQIQLLLSALVSGLGLGTGDRLLDLCCGNGLITHRVAPLCRSVVGVDFSRDLIDLARTHHAADNIEYIVESVEHLQRAVKLRDLPAKICINQGLQHFTRSVFTAMLRQIDGTALRVLCTDVPDVARIYNFYNTEERRADLARRRVAGTEAIGTWWAIGDLQALCQKFGYRATAIAQDPRRFTAHYRFDLLITRP